MQTLLQKSLQDGLKLSQNDGMTSRENFYLRKALPALLIMTLVFMLPLGAVFIRAFFSSGYSFLSMLKDRQTWRILGFTCWEAFLSAFFSVALALPFAVFFSRYKFPGRRLLLTISDAAFALPSILVILGFVIFYGNNGTVNRVLQKLSGGKVSVQILYSFKAVILAHVYLNFPIAFSLLTQALSSMPDKEEKASMLLGASRIKTFWRITFPKVKGTVLSSFILVFLFCFPSFLIVMTLGGNPKFYTIEAEIYRRTYIDAAPAASAALSVFSFAIMSLLLLLTGYGRQERRISRDSRMLEKATGRKLLKAFLVSLLIILFMAPPLLSIFYRSFYTKDGDFTLKAWKAITSTSRAGIATPINAITNSIVVALLSAFLSTELATSIAICSARRNSRIIPLLTSLPMAAGSVSLGLGFSFISAMIASRSLVVAYTLVLLAHIVCVMPFTVRTLVPGAKRIPERLTLAAATLGSLPKEAYRKVERPMLKGYRRRAFAFAFALSLGEVNATLALSEGKVTTLPILIYKMISNYNYQGASALAVILLTVAIVVFAIGESGGKENGLS